MPLRRAAWASLALLVVVALLWQGLSWTRTNEPTARFNQGANAAWLAHTWVGDAHDDAEVAALARTLTAHQIGYAFAHVGPLEADGTIPPERAPYASDFAAALKRHAPGVRLLAWIGQLETRGGGALDLGDPAVRARVVATAGSFAALPGWDGVHYDIEPLFDDDARFLALLDETRPRLVGRTLSLATPKWFPGGRWDRVSSRAGAAVWSAAYYAAVARRADQLAVMLYDTALPWERAYSLYVKQQTTNILWAVRDTPVEVLIGVPVYQGRNAGFRDDVENIGSSLRGLALALNNSSTESRARFRGVALYPEWEVDDTEWALYDRVWLGR